MERPVIATAVGGTPEVIADGVSGRLVPAETPDALAAAMAQLLLQPRLAATLATGARRRAEEHFGSRAMVRRLEDVYASVLRNGRNGNGAGAAHS